jgi:hypothetical protein
VAARAVLLLLALIFACSSGEHSVALILPGNTMGAQSMLVALEPRREAVRFYAVDLTAPAKLVVDTEAPARAYAMLLGETLEELDLAAGLVIDTPGGRPLPASLMVLSAAIDTGREASWSIDQSAAGVFDAFHLPAETDPCRLLERDVFSIAPVTEGQTLFTHGQDDRVLLATLDGTVYSVHEENGVLAPHRATLSGSPPLAAMAESPNGTHYAADITGAIGEASFDPLLLMMRTEPTGTPFPGPDPITRLAADDDGDIAVIAANVLHYRRNDVWHELKRLPINPERIRASRMVFRDGVLYVVHNPARYLVEVAEDLTVSTSTASTSSLSVLLIDERGSEPVFYAGDIRGVIYKRDPTGRWDFFVDTLISDELLQVQTSGAELVFVGYDGWAGRIIPGFGVCEPGPILPSAFNVARLGGDNVFFGAEELARVRL